MKFSLQNLWNWARSKRDIHTPIHCILNWCQLHHYHISYIMWKQQTIHLTTFSTQNWKKVFLNFSDYLSDFFPSRLWLVMSAYVLLLTTPFLFIIAENTNQHFKLSIIGDYKFFLISSKYSYNCKQKGNKLTLVFVSNHHNRPFYHNWFSIGQLGKRHMVWSQLSLLCQFCFVLLVIICSFNKFRNFS